MPTYLINILHDTVPVAGVLCEINPDNAEPQSGNTNAQGVFSAVFPEEWAEWFAGMIDPLYEVVSPLPNPFHVEEPNQVDFSFEVNEV